MIVPADQHAVGRLRPPGRAGPGRRAPRSATSAGNKPIDRILCIHPDGKVTVFADKLYAVFGLAYLDGKLYVHHIAQVHRLHRRRRPASARTATTSSTAPTPTPGPPAGFNDHIPVQHPPGDGRLLLHGHRRQGHLRRGRQRRRPKAELRGGGRGPLPPGRHRPGGLRHRHPQPPRRLDQRRRRDVHLRQHRRRPRLVDPLHPHGRRRLLRLPLGLQARRRHDPPRSRSRSASRQARPALHALADGRVRRRLADCGAIGYNEDAPAGGVPRQPVPLRVGQGQRRSASSSSAPAARTRSSSAKTCSSSPRRRPFRPLGIYVTTDGMGFYVTDWNYGGWKNKKDGRPAAEA